MNTILRLLAILLAVCSSNAASQAVPVEIVKRDHGYELLRGGEPYVIQGTGGSSYLELLVERGGNSIRTWGIRDLEPREWPDGRTMGLLDRAHELGLTVCVGIWVQHDEGGYIHDGFDYEDPESLDRQLEYVKDAVRKWKDHPAVLVWGIGNEVLGTDRARGLKELNRIAKAVKEIDPHHPTMTVLSGIWPDKGALFAEHCPEIDILGVNAYGGLAVVASELLEQGYDGPYVVTEYGPVGWWEVPSTEWGAEIEQASGPKARTYQELHQKGVAEAGGRCLGGYVFKWGNKQERTDTWFSMILEGGELTQAVDEITKIWTGSYPDNRAPIVEGIECELALQRVAPGGQVTASVVATDPEDDPLDITWIVRRESDDKNQGGVEERVPEEITGSIAEQSERNATVNVPTDPGGYRLYVYVRDGNGGVGTANIPFFVEGDE